MARVRMLKETKGIPMAGERRDRASYGDVKEFEKGKIYHVSESLWRLWRPLGVAEIVEEESNGRLQDSLFKRTCHDYKWGGR